MGALAEGPHQARVQRFVLVAGDGTPVDEEGHGTLSQQRLYQLIRERGSIADRTFEITFSGPGAEAYVFTFG